MRARHRVNKEWMGVSLPQTTNLGQTRDRAVGGVKGLLSTGLSLLEFITPGANHDTIEDLKLRLEPSSQNQKFGAEVAGIIGMLLPGGQAEGLSASSAKAGVNLKKALASEQQMGEILSGAGAVIAGPGGRVALPDAPRLASEYGGKAGDWVKVGCKRLRNPSSQGGRGRGIV